MTDELNKIVEVESTNKEFEYRYQAFDDLNRPLGAVQVFKGKTVQEVLDKVADANKNLIKLNRELNRRVRLGEFETDQLPNDVIKMKTDQLLKPKELSLEEKAQFARDILDPEKFDDVNNRLIEAQLGAKPEEIRNRINRQEQRLANIEAKQEAEIFVSSNPDYYTDPENFRTITNWMVKNNLAPVRENFQLAYDTLKTEGLMIQAPRAVEPPPVIPKPNVPDTPPVLVTQTTPAIPNPPVSVPVRVPSGLTRDSASDIGVQPQIQRALTKRMVDNMPSDEYKKRLKEDPDFARQVNELFTPKKA